MRNIEFKYNVGDYIRFKGHYDSDASCGLFDLAGTIAVVIDRADFNGPTYKLSCDEDGWYQEGCFEGLASGSEFLAQQALASGVDTVQGLRQIAIQEILVSLRCFLLKKPSGTEFLFLLSLPRMTSEQ